MSRPEGFGATLTVDLDAVVENWRRIKARVGKARVAGILKADAYGLGLAQVGPALYRAGCRDFFVARLSEGQRLRVVVPEQDASITVLDGFAEGSGEAFQRAELRPALNDLGQIEHYARFARKLGRKLPAALHVDTGMNRLGLPKIETESLLADTSRLEGIDLALVMSHFVASEEADNPLNARQIAAFAAIRARFPNSDASLANSSGVFLGGAAHYDLVRPGVALYGGNPLPGRPNPMAQTIELSAQIIQIRSIDRWESVGYGATHIAARPARIATVPVGYADGYPRSLSAKGSALVNGILVPVVGRVSMDLVTLDVTALAPDTVRPGTLATLLGGALDADAVGETAGTISYEVLTRLGQRYRRDYRGGR